jgi:hypothetical protein
MSTNEPTMDKPKGKRAKHSRDVVTAPTSSLIDNDAFICDMARYAEGGLTEKQIRKKYRLPDTMWTSLADDDLLVEKIEAEQTRRIRDGSCKRERAQQLVVDAPQVLGSIMSDPGANNRHRVDAVKALDALATPPGQGAAADASRFSIVINLTADGGNPETDIIRFDKPRAIGVSDDGSPIDAAPQDVIAAIATNKRGNDNGGQPL